MTEKIKSAKQQNEEVWEAMEMRGDNGSTIFTATTVLETTKAMVKAFKSYKETITMTDSNGVDTVIHRG